MLGLQAVVSHASEMSNVNLVSLVKFLQGERGTPFMHATI